MRGREKKRGTRRRRRTTRYQDTSHSLDLSACMIGFFSAANKIIHENMHAHQLDSLEKKVLKIDTLNSHFRANLPLLKKREKEKKM